MIMRMPAQNYKTWEVIYPHASHYRPATCAEVDCSHYLNGWQTVVDESTNLGQARAYYIRHGQTRGFTESRDDRNGIVVTVFKFHSGQTCFREHEKVLDRPAMHGVRRGTGRFDFGERHWYDRSDQWQDDLAVHLDVLRVAQQ